MISGARPVEPSDAQRLVALFEACDCPCFCRYWHFDGDKNDWLARCALEPDTSRDELTTALAARSDQALGVVYETPTCELVGWAKVCPALAIDKAYTQRFYRRLPCFAGERSGVFLIGCFLVHPGHRRAGVATALVHGAVELARSRGARAVEALPRRTSDVVSDGELWCGPFSALVGAGFVEVGGEGPYPVLRRDLEGGASR
jgi:GNAT superfamily N-acetyltransferase